MKTKRVYVVTWRFGYEEFDDGAKAFEKVVELTNDGYCGVQAIWRDEPVPDVWSVNGMKIQVPAGTPTPPLSFLQVVSGLAGFSITVIKL